MPSLIAKADGNARLLMFHTLSNIEQTQKRSDRIRLCSETENKRNCIGSALLIMWRSLGERVLNLQPKWHPLRRILASMYISQMAAKP
jgi:hypothetical protein